MSDLPILESFDQKVNLREALATRYLAYALSTITNRALPDVRDGVKPVHRRLLFAMRQLKLDPQLGFKKCARVVGDVIGKYHPHGDKSVYDALVRLAQEFSVRYPLIDGQGNFGNIDGDGAAAMRYTEARMTYTAGLLLEDINKNTVDFQTTYDGEEEEPLVLPAAFPNLLANGASGIAVGMATNIPPHNIDEICDAALHLIKYPQTKIETLMTYIQGPDFPTAGVIIESKSNILKAYQTGKGSIRLRAGYEIETLPRGMWQIVITQMPYQVQKSRLIEKMAELIHNKILTVVDDICDESAEDIRLVIVPKSKTLDAKKVMNILFNHTDLEIRYNMNLNVLTANSVPEVLNLRELLWQWLEHRKNILQRKTQFRLDEIIARLELLKGYLIAYLNLDEVIRIIREEDHPRSDLMNTFQLTEKQAEAILNMRLRALRKLEEMTIQQEYDALAQEKEGLQTLLNSEELQWKQISVQIRDVKKYYKKLPELGARRTLFSEINEADLEPIQIPVEKEAITIILSEKGWIRYIKTHIDTPKTLKYKTGDSGKFIFHSYTDKTLILFTAKGRSYTLDAHKLPSGRGHGEPINLMIDLDDDDKIIEIFSHKPERQLIIASLKGQGFIISEKDLVSQRKAGKTILVLSEGDEALTCVPVLGDCLAVLNQEDKLLSFSLSELPVMSRGKGVRLQKVQSSIVALASYDVEKGLSITDKGGRVKVIKDMEAWYGKRAQAGKKRPKGVSVDSMKCSTLVKYLIG